MQGSVGKFGQILSKESRQNMYIGVGARLFEVLDSLLLIAFPSESSSVHILSWFQIYILKNFQAHISD